MSGHALLSPSGAHRWLRCPGSVVLEAPYPETSSAYADEGTAAHFLGSECLINGLQADFFLGREIVIREGGASWYLAPYLKENPRFEVDAAMAEHVQVYVDLVRGLHNDGLNPLMVEQRVPIGQITTEKGAEGTSDAVVYAELDDGTYEVIVTDLKYGQGVRVDAEENEQMMTYALGAIELASLVVDVSRARLIISQPRVSKAPSEWSCTVEHLEQFASRTKLTAAAAMKMHQGEMAPILNPGPKQCRFCKAKADCAALTGEVLKEIQIVPATVPNTDLGEHLAKVEMIRDWCNAIEAKAERELHNGNEVPGYKLVQGKRGNRAWTSVAEAETTMKSMRLKQDEMYEFSLISPTKAETLLKETPKRWARLKEHIVQADGKPTVAPESDKRPAIVITPAIDDIPDLTLEELA